MPVVDELEVDEYEVARGAVLLLGGAGLRGGGARVGVLVGEKKFTHI